MRFIPCIVLQEIAIEFQPHTVLIAEGLYLKLLYTLFELTNQIAQLQVAKYLLINPPGLLINSPGSLINP